MKIIKVTLTAIILTFTILNDSIVFAQQSTSFPYLVKKGNAAQIMLNNEPLLMLAGELGNSSASDIRYMDWIWDKVQEIGLNTLLAPVYWELIEPEEGKYDFSLVEGLINGARKKNIKLVFLWFGSWKNSMSCYVPAWVKTNQKRFPRAVDKEGKSQEMLSVFSEENRNTDAKAFRALMKHIHKIDSKEKTVILVQVENEIGMIPSAREYTTEANIKYSEAVPKELLIFLEKNKESLEIELLSAWQKSGFKTNGSWEELFGKSLNTEEIFMAWNYAQYVDWVTKAGKEEYALPMYVNAALNRPGYEPGRYPSGGPLPHLLDVWRAGAPSIDFLSPDIYFKNFAEWCQKYDKKGNPLFIPEATLNENTSTNALYAFGQHNAMGFSPFSIESLIDHKNAKLTKTYNLLNQLAPKILKSQGQNLMRGYLLDEEKKIMSFNLGEYKINISHDYTFPWVKHPAGPWPQVGGMIISEAPDEFYVAGEGVILTFEPLDTVKSNAGILYIEEGKFIDGKWLPFRRLNGDESHQGRHLRIPYNEIQIQKIKLYRYH